MESFVVVRHGETEWSREGRHTSHTDLPLIPEGRERARALAAELSGWSFSLVLCSPLRRARETCSLAGFDGVAELCDELHEWDYGEYEGITTAEIRSRAPGWDLWRDGCPGGESPAQVVARAESVIARALACEGDVLAFAHGHILRVIAARWVQAPVEFGARLLLSAGGLGVLGIDRGTRALARWNA